MKSADPGGASDLPGQVLAVARNQGLESYLLERPLVVAVSGGADSLALLLVLCHLRGERAPQTLHVAHLDHSFRGVEGEEDARFVASIAGSLGLKTTIRKEDVPAYAGRCGLSPEDAARRVRYSFLAEVCSRYGDAVAVAHNADDQAETVLMHLLRGSGIGGLGGMKMLSTVSVDEDTRLCPEESGASRRLTVLRPLLETWRNEIEPYCSAKGVTPRVDATNEDRKYRRNLVRHDVLPALEAANPGVKKRLVRLADLARADDDALNRLAEIHLDEVARPVVNGHAIEFDGPHFSAIPLALQRRIVRIAIERLAGSLADFELADIEKVIEVASGLPEAPSAAVLRRGLTISRRGDSALLANSRAAQEHVVALEQRSEWPLIEPDRAYTLAPGQTLFLEGGWSLETRTGMAQGEIAGAGDYEALFDADALPGGPLVVRARRPGDFIRPLGLGGTKSLQDLYVDAKIPALLRERLALLTASEGPGEVLWVPGKGGRRTNLAAVQSGTKRVLRVQFRRGG